MSIAVQRMILVVATVVAVPSAVDAAGKPTADESDVRGWIADLGSRDFQRREAATRSLTLSGTAAVGPLAEAIAGGHPEVTWRGLRILKEIGFGGDAAASHAALAALKSLARSPDPSVARSAARAVAHWPQYVHERAVERLRQLGGTVRASGTTAHFAGGVVVFEGDGGGHVVELGEVIVARERAALELRRAEVRRVLEARLARDKAATRLQRIRLEKARREHKRSAAGGKGAHEKKSGEKAAVPERFPLIPVGPQRKSPRPDEKRPPAARPAEPKKKTDDVELAEEDEHYIEAEAVASVSSNLNAALQSTTHLRIDSTWKGGDEGLALAARLRNLHSIELHNARLTDKAVEHLARVPDLKSLKVHGGSISGEALKRLRRLKPQLAVYAYGQGFLGVEGGAAPGGRGFLVKRVYPGSCAEKAGLRAADVIVSLNGYRLTDLGSLQLCVFDRPKGHPVTLKVLRDGKELVLEGDLGTRADAGL